MNAASIREANINDLPYIIKLIADDELGAKREEYKLPLPQYYIDAFNNISSGKNSILLVACYNQSVIGCLQITFTQYLSHKGSIRATIENVHIAANSRRLGIGTQLMKYAINIAKSKNCSIVQLTSDISRKDAHKFYEKLGFSPTHVGMKLHIKNNL